MRRMAVIRAGRCYAQNEADVRRYDCNVFLVWSAQLKRCRGFPRNRKEAVRPLSAKDVAKAFTAIGNDRHHGIEERHGSAH